MRKCIVAAYVSIIMFLVFFATSIPLFAQDSTVKLRYSTFWPPLHAMSKLNAEWCKEVEKQTNGRVKISHFAGGILTPPMQTYDGVVKGIADVGQSMFAYSPGRFPLTEVLMLPMGCSSGTRATQMCKAYYRKFQPEELGDTKMMYLHCSVPSFFMVKKSISSIDDLKGLRIKANAENAAIVTALGAFPVTLPITETYDALQKGLVDGVLLAKESLKGWRFGEVAKTVLNLCSSGYTVPFYVVMNKEKWNSISKADQETIEKINEEYAEKSGKVWDDVDKEGAEFGAQKGIKFVNASKEEEARTAGKMKPILANYVQKMKAKGLPGEEALKFCLDYIKTHP